MTEKTVTSFVCDNCGRAATRVTGYPEESGWFSVNLIEQDGDTVEHDGYAHLCPTCMPHLWALLQGVSFAPSPPEPLDVGTLAAYVVYDGPLARAEMAKDMADDRGWFATCRAKADDSGLQGWRYPISGFGPLDVVEAELGRHLRSAHDVKDEDLTPAGSATTAAYVKQAHE